MTQEEIEKQAEEYIRENVCNKERVFGSQSVCSDKAIGECNECGNFCYFATINRKSYLAGAKWGMEHATEWHDLRKNPDDLPKEGVEVLNDDGVRVVRINRHWRYVYGGEWEEDAYVAHWCELPTYKE